MSDNDDIVVVVVKVYLVFLMDMVVQELLISQGIIYISS